MDINKKLVEALYQNSFFHFGFDVEEGMVEEIIVSKEHNHIDEFGVSFPCLFDSLINKFYSFEYLDGMYSVDKTMDTMNCQRLLDEYNSGKRCVENYIYIPELDVYNRLLYILTWDDVKNHVCANVIGMNISEVEKLQMIAMKKLQSELAENDDIIECAEIGIWHIFLDGNKPPKMRASSKMCELLGINGESMSEEEIYEAWNSRIKDSSRPSVEASVSEMIEKGRSENTYSWIHPKLGEIFVRCGGTSQKYGDDGIMLRGYHMDVTDFVTAETEQKQLLADALAEIKKHENSLNDRMEIISSMANIYICSYYMDMEKGTFVEIDNHLQKLTDITGKEGDSQKSFNAVAESIIKTKYLESFLEFTDITTLNERLRDKAYISMQFEGNNYGWIQGLFIAGDRDEEGNCRHTIWCIRDVNEEKNKEEILVYNSNVDKLTSLYNRRMYEEDIKKYTYELNDRNLVYVSMDLNGLKRVNDSLGHDAGDRMIKAAAVCMKQCLGPYGRIYRIGGDEFCAIIFSSKAQLKLIKEDLEETVENYKVEGIKDFSISCGYVMRSEFPEMEINELCQIADKRMYENKKDYYSNKGIDLRAQQDAFKAMFVLYTKMLKINFQTGSYSIIKMQDDEKSTEKGFSENIFDWLTNFANTGQVHPDDLEEYLKQTSKEYLLDYFGSGKKAISILYRRMLDDRYRHVVMEMIVADEYSADNQVLFLYVKNIEQ